MTTDEDLDRTFHDIATAGFQVVRTWAFNDVSQKPPSGTYFQVCFHYKFTTLADHWSTDFTERCGDDKRRRRWLAALRQSGRYS